MNPIGLYDIGKERTREKQEQADVWRLVDQAEYQHKQTSKNFARIGVGFGFVIVLLGLAISLVV